MKVLVHKMGPTSCGAFVWTFVVVFRQPTAQAILDCRTKEGHVKQTAVGPFFGYQLALHASPFACGFGIIRECRCDVQG